jgi:hypothetical protein
MAVWLLIPAETPAHIVDGEVKRSISGFPSEIGQVLATLLDVLIITRSVLGADETVGPAATISRHVHVALTLFDRCLDVPHGSLRQP